MTARLTRTPWIVVQFNYPALYRCLRCGAKLPLSLPQEASIVVAMGQAFRKVHRLCLAQKGGR